MNGETTFDKEAFANLLDRAKGDRSINQFADDTDVSAPHISRFLRQMIDAPPTPETISKFAKKAYNGVTYKDFMIAAGHISEDSSGEEDSPINRRSESIRMEQELFQVIMLDLMNSDFKWTMQKPDKRERFPDLIINLEDGEYKRHCYEFKYIRNGRIPQFPLIQRLYYQLATFELNESDKFFLVINDETTFNFMLKRPPINLRVNLYIMLVDMEGRRVVREEQLSGY